MAMIRFNNVLIAWLLSWTAIFATIITTRSNTSAAAAAFTLITFDVDGTLVRGTGQEADSSAHAQAFSYACEKVLGGVGTTDAGKRRRVVKPVAQALPRHLFHGSTDGLILCRLAKAELDVDQVSEVELKELMKTMYDYIAVLDDAQVAKGIDILPGVLDHLTTLGKLQKQPDAQLACGLVTGNVEGIARRKMRAVGVLDTQALAPPARDQVDADAAQQQWPGVQDIAFLGGFGSDYCSRNIVDLSRNYLDRGEQIAIAARRCQSTLSSPMSRSDTRRLSRVVHVGDAPADVLAAKAYSQWLRAANNNSNASNNKICVGMVAVATGSYSVEQLQEAAGEPVPGQWEPVVLENGMADSNFLHACGL